MLKNIRIGFRLALGNGVVTLAFLIGGLVVVNCFDQIREETGTLFEHPLKVRTSIREVRIQISNMDGALMKALLADSPESVSLQASGFQDALEQAERSLATVKELFLGDKRQVEAIQSKLGRWKQDGEKVFSLASGGMKAEAKTHYAQTCSALKNDLDKAVQPVMDFAINKSGQLMVEIVGKGEQGTKLIYWTFGLVLVLSTAIAVLSGLSISRPLKTCVDAVERISHGHLDTSLPEAGRRDEIGRLIGAVSKMSDALRNRIAEIKESAGILARAATDISATTSQFAGSFPEVATAVNQTVTSMREIKQTAQLSSDKSNELGDSARNVAAVSQSGARSVAETVETMDRIQENMTSIAQSIVNLSEQAQSIAEIISAVEDLAEQSRLLAVNAAIEAAKAGEQGKGFAVVAAEIKNLADQSKGSTTQVRSILLEIQRAMSKAVMATEKGGKAVEKGVLQAGHSGESIQALAGNVADTADAMLQIETTNKQQLIGIEQVFAAMESVNTAMAQNTAGIRQLQKEAKGLEELGNRLKENVSRYTV